MTDAATELLDPARDVIQRIRAQPNWSENLLFVMYASPGADGLAAWAHWSRVPARPQLWEGILALYLPGGELLLHRSFGPGPPADLGPASSAGHGDPGDGGAAGTGPLSFRCVVPLRRWSLRFDGMMRRTGTAEVSAGPLADGPWEPVRFAADFEGGVENVDQKLKAFVLDLAAECDPALPLNQTKFQNDVSA